MRRLRDKLVLSHAALVLLIVGLALTVVRLTTLVALKAALRDQVAKAYRPFEFVQDPLFRQRGDMARHIAEDPALTETRRHYSGELRSLRDQAGDMARQGHVDLLLLTDLQGRVLVEYLSEGEPRLQRADRLPIVQMVLEHGRPANGYARYPDGSLYAVGAAPLVKGDFTEGAVLVGNRVDASLARAIGEGAGKLSVLVAADGRVVAGWDARHDDGATLGAQLEAYLKTWSPPPAVPPWKVRRGQAAPSPEPVEISLGSSTYLALPYPLWDPTAAQPVAWMFLMQPMDWLDAQISHQVRLILGLGVAAMLLALSLGRGVAARISRPVEALAEKMRLVGTGDLHQSADVRGNDEVARLAHSFNEMVGGLRQKELLKKFVPFGAREAIERDAEGRLVLGGSRLRVTALFSDLRGFTTISEQLDPTEVVSMLNEYLEAMIEVVHHKHGDVIDYIGDAILAVFHDGQADVPIPSAVLAVECALSMQEALAALEARSTNANVVGLRMGIGINTGPVVEGNIGTQERVKHTIVGDAVNVASRIQDRSRDGRHTCILLGPATKADVADAYALDFFGNETLKGVTAPLPIWEVISRTRGHDAG